MKKVIFGLALVVSATAFAAEDIKTKCTYTNDIGTKLIEEAVVSLAKTNSNSGYSSFVSQSVSITEGQQNGDRALVCVTSKL